MKPSHTFIMPVAIAAAGVLAFAQPASTSRSPLDPPSNGVRRSDPTWHALVNATVHTGDGRVLEHATVVVRDGRIVSISAVPGVAGDGKTIDSPAAPAGARVWDCTGLHIYPAFIDPYIEVDAPRAGKDDPGRHWNGAITPERRALDGPGLSEGAAKELRELGFGAAAISPKGGIFRGTAAVVSLAKHDDDISSARPSVYATDVYEAAALDASGGGESLAWAGYPGSEMGAIALMRQTLIDADWQAEARGVGAFSGPANSLDALWRGRAAGEAPGRVNAGLPAGKNSSEPMTLLFDCPDELDVLRAMKIAGEFRRRGAILGSGLEFRRLAAIKEAGASMFILPVNFPEAPKMASISEADSVELREMMTWEQAPTNLRRMREAGASMALTTSKLKGRSKFWDNVRVAIRHGLSPDDALAMVTSQPAKFIGVDDQLGSIAVGKRANLTITDADWFDPHALDGEKSRRPKIRDVWIDGQRYEIAAAPGEKLEGVWDVTIQPPPPPMAEGKMKITFTFDEDNKLSITRYVAGDDGKVTSETIRPKEQRLEKNRLYYTFEHEPFGEPGVFISQATIEGETMHGEFIRSSGVRMSFDATRRPGLAGIGEWRVIEYDGKAKNPADRDQVYVSITKDAVKLTFIDPAGKRIVIKGEDVKVGVDDKKVMEGAKQPAAEPAPAPAAAGEQPAATPAVPASPAAEPVPANFAASFTHPLEKLGGKGKSTDTLTVDPSDGNVLVGKGVLPKEEGAAEGAVHSYKLGRMRSEELAAARAAYKPRGMAGTWKVTLVDDGTHLLEADRPMFIEVSDTGTVTFKGKNPAGKAVEIGATDVKVGDAELSYSVDVGALHAVEDAAATPQMVKVTARRLNDLMIGTLDFAEQGTHTLKAARVAVWGDEPGDDDSEILEAGSVPEGLAYPFGPYSVSELPPVQNVAVQHATIWTSGPAGNIEDGTLVVLDGKVSMVMGPDVAMKLPPDTVVIDAKGKHVTAGLIDCHSHTGISRGVNEGGQAVTSEVRIGDVTNPDAISWYRQLAGGITTVNNLHGSANPIGGQNQVNKNRWGVVKPDDMHFEGAIPGIKFALGENVKQGNGPRLTTRYPRSRMGVEALIRDRFTAAKEYIAGRGGDSSHQREALQKAMDACRGALASDEARNSPDKRAQVNEMIQKLETRLAELAKLEFQSTGRVFHRDLELEALAEILEGKRLVHCHSYRQDEILMLCRVAGDFGFKVGTFQHILEGYKVADELRTHSGGASGFSDWWAYKIEVQDAIPQGGPIMHEQGVVVSYNSDSDEMARRMNVEAGKAVKYSVDKDGKPTISPEEALKFVTLNPAKQLMIDSRVGSLEKGKDGDFVIWSGNPLSSMSRAEQTWIDGRCYFSLEKDAASRERITAQRARLTQKILGGLAGKKDKRDDAKGADEKKEGGEAPAEPRRRRRPQDDMGSGADVTPMEEIQGGAPNQWWMRRYYMDLYMRGLPIDSARQGECGCYAN